MHVETRSRLAGSNIWSRGNLSTSAAGHRTRAGRDFFQLGPGKAFKGASPPKLTWLGGQKGLTVPNPRLFLLGRAAAPRTLVQVMSFPRDESPDLAPGITRLHRVDSSRDLDLTWTLACAHATFKLRKAIRQIIDHLRQDTKSYDRIMKDHGQSTSKCSATASSFSSRMRRDASRRRLCNARNPAAPEARWVGRAPGSTKAEGSTAPAAAELPHSPGPCAQAR